MNFCPGSKNYIIGIRMRISMMTEYINELCHFYKVSLIKTGLMFHKYHLLNQLQVFMRYKKITKCFCQIHFCFIILLLYKTGNLEFT